ncbi:MAG: FG-GAP repeat domain-containing protein, partial [Thermoanaerobaculia bacterium]
MRKAYVLALLSMLTVAGTGAAQNLIVNGNFDSNVLGWTFQDTGSFTLDSSHDADSNPLSGSGRLENAIPLESGSARAMQCVAVTGGKSNDIWARIRIPSGQTTSGYAMVVVQFYDGASCLGNSVGGVSTPQLNSTTTDTWVVSEVFSQAAPVAAVGARVNLWVNKTEATGSLVVDFDTLAFSPAVPRMGDFNGDGLAEMSVFRPGPAVWYSLSSGGSYTWKQFGGPTDVPVPADYNGDRVTNIAVFHPGNGVWYVLYPAGYSTAIQWGVSGDIPVPGDFDGDGRADRAVFRPSAGTWFVLTATGGTTSMNWGVNGDTPVSGDFDGDGKADCAVVRRSGGVMTWFVLKS